VRSAGRTTLYSRRQNVLNQKFHYVATALKDLPEDTVIDGELVALGPDGRPLFDLLHVPIEDVLQPCGIRPAQGFSWRGEGCRGVSVRFGMAAMTDLSSATRALGAVFSEGT
jgi:hypothetical protein